MAKHALLAENRFIRAGKSADFGRYTKLSNGSRPAGGRDRQHAPTGSADEVVRGSGDHAGALVLRGKVCQRGGYAGGYTMPANHVTKPFCFW